MRKKEKESCKEMAQNQTKRYAAEKRNEVRMWNKVIKKSHAGARLRIK